MIKSKTLYRNCMHLEQFTHHLAIDWSTLSIYVSPLLGLECLFIHSGVNRVRCIIWKTLTQKMVTISIPVFKCLFKISTLLINVQCGLGSPFRYQCIHYNKNFLNFCLFKFAFKIFIFIFKYRPTFLTFILKWTFIYFMLCNCNNRY